MNTENNTNEEENTGFVVKNLETGGVNYIGKIYTDHEAYVELLAGIHGLKPGEVLDRLCQGYQSLQLTRIAQGYAKGGKLEEGQEVEVRSLYGTRTSKWGELAKDVKILQGEQKKLLSEEKYESITDDQWRKVAQVEYDARMERSKNLFA